MIKLITTAQVLPLRNIVLRNNAGIERSKFAEDDFPETFHIGYLLNDEVLGVATFFPKDHPYGGPDGYQLRGMATTQQFAGKGYGAALVDFAITYLKNKNARYIWCNARASAVGFYEKLGFKIISEEFNVEHIGPHYQMFRSLTAPLTEHSNN